MVYTLPPTGARGVVTGPLALPAGSYTAFFSDDGDGGNVLGTIRGRLGLAWDRFLVYGTGGVAFRGSHDNSTAFVINNATGATAATYTCGTPFSCRSSSTVGWAAGGGVQYAVTSNVSVGVEYLHAGFDDRDRIDPILTSYYGTATTSNRGSRDIDIVRGTLNVKFGSLFGIY